MNHPRFDKTQCFYTLISQRPPLSPRRMKAYDTCRPALYAQRRDLVPPSSASPSGPESRPPRVNSACRSPLSVAAVAVERGQCGRLTLSGIMLGIEEGLGAVLAVVGALVLLLRDAHCAATKQDPAPVSLSQRILVSSLLSLQDESLLTTHDWSPENLRAWL